MDKDTTVVVPQKEYKRLVARSLWLSCLEEAGVDNWQGIEEAISIRRERLEEEDKHG